MLFTNAAESDRQLLYVLFCSYDGSKGSTWLLFYLFDEILGLCLVLMILFANEESKGKPNIVHYGGS